MFARCSRCDRTFEAPQFGRQRCPHCQAEVFIRDPREPVTDAYAPPRTFNDAPVFAEGEGIPWDRREQIGLWRALLDTMKLALTEPNAFFSHIRYGRTTGIHLYFFLVAVVPALVGGLLSQLFLNPAQQIEQMQRIYRQTGQAEMARNLDQLSSFFSSYGKGFALLTLLTIPLWYFATLYLFAGISHLVMKLMKKDTGGWEGTLSAYVFAFSPGFLNIVPGCGWLAMWCWITALQVIGLAKAHKTTSGYGAIGVFSVHGVFFCCVCAGVGVLSLLAGVAAGMATQHV